jgi:polyphosphate kinase
VGLTTTHADIVDDVSNVFNYLTGYSSKADYSALLMAPQSLRARLRGLIEREAEHARQGRTARIIIKINGLTDTQLIQDLYRASQAGVDIDLIVRGICCLRPGVRGVSDRITVRSIVGRFLEHSRVFWFENGGNPEAFIGSADLMERNLDRRVEVLCPVLDPSLRGYLRDVVLDLYLRDTAQAWVLESSGEYVPPAGGNDGVNAQLALVTRHTVDYLRDGT